MPDFDNNGASVHYELLGAGPPLLMIAGIASDGASWAPLTPLLADRFRLILIDNRGSGRTRCDGPLHVADMLGDCVALLDRLGIAQADVIGHSMGGGLGLQLAARYPARVHRLVTLTCAGIGPKGRELFADLQRLYFELPPERWFRLLFQWLFSEPFFKDATALGAAAEASAAYLYRQLPENFARQVAALETFPAIDPGRIPCPVLALAAERDILVPPPLVQAVHKAIPNCRFEIIPAAAHSIHWEQPEAVAKAVREFLA